MISKYSVRRPYTVLVGVILVIVLGVVSLMKMTTDLLPDMSFQYALVVTTDMGASPEKVESEVTAPIEAAMATTSNIKNISSISYNSYSIVTLEYEQNANMDSVVIEIQQSLDQISGQWSDSVGTPMIMKINPDMLPVVAAAVDVKGMSASEISDYVENDLVPSLESLEGVASVSTTGQLDESIQVTMNQDKIDALNKKIKKSIDKQFTDAQKKIDDSCAKVESGKESLTSGQDQLSDALNETMEKRDELYKTEEDLQKQLKELQKQQKSLTKIQEGINTVMTSDGYTSITTVLKDNPDAAQLPEMKQQIEAFNKAIKEQFSGLSAMGITVNTYEDLPTAAANVSATLTKVNTGIKTIDSALEKVQDGKVSLSTAMDTLNANAALAALQMSSSSAELSNAAASLETAQSNLDDAKETAYDSADLNNILTKDTLSNLFTAQNFDMPAGYAMDGDTQYLVRVGESVKSEEDLNDLVLMDLNMDGIDPIRLSDVADVEMTDNSDETYAVVNGNPAVTLSIEKQTGYSTGEVTDRILDKFDQLEKADENLNMTVLMNQGVYIDMIVKSVMQNMIWGAILAIIVLLLFLKDIKPTIVIACAIPLSVVTAVVLMYFTGITMNIISMSGLLLGIGMLVDNSIVVIENIYRLRHEGYSIKKAAVSGASQVTGAIIASTLTTVSVYAPIIFTEGITRQLFVDLALTIAYTLIASLVVALTFVPAMASVTLRKTREIRHPWFDAMRDAYGRFLAGCLRFKPIVFIVAVVLLAGSAALSLSKGMNFMDMDMETNQISVSIAAKEGENLTFDELKDASNEVIDKISDIKGIDTIGASIGGNSTMSLMGGGSDTVTMYVLLDEDSDVSNDEVSAQILDRTKDMDCDVTCDSSSMDYSAYFGQGISVRIKGNDIDTLQKLAGEVASLMEDTKGTTDVDDGLDDATPQLTITVDKEKAAKYGYTVAQVYQLVAAKMADSSSVTTISTDIKDYEVYLQTEDQQDTTLDDIKDLKFTYTNKDGKEKKIPLTKIATMKDTTTLSTISRDAQSRYLTVSCGVDEDHNVTLISNSLQKEIDKLDIPDGYSIEMTGEDETINESMKQLVLMLVLAVIFIYLIMVVQFQSLVSPFIIMFSIPLAFTGGFIALFISGQEVSVTSMLGFIMLAGLIVNNGIVLIDYINQARREGTSKKDAIIESGKTRLRPILMTALTTILAMSTSAIGIGEGSEMMRPMAITIIGGLVYGTLLTLVVIPCIYDAFNREKDMTEEEL
ncbi:MAG: efflux RND transporter permease subunit [Lachnobacterium sp.]|nr:efflux RND transporter permease subunit [Lachnobacterium sp.]